MAHNHGSSSSSSSMMMSTALHFTGGDSLLFKSIQPSSAGALAGASLVLFALAILERWLSATRLVLNERWHRRALNLAPEKSNRGDSAFMQESISVEGSESSSSRRKLPVVARRPRTIAPFIFSYDASRGAFHALQTLLSYVLMLAVMTTQAAYLIAIVAGAAFGELLFGRYRMFTSNHSHVH